MNNKLEIGKFEPKYTFSSHNEIISELYNKQKKESYIANLSMEDKMKNKEWLKNRIQSTDFFDALDTAFLISLEDSDLRELFKTLLLQKRKEEVIIRLAKLFLHKYKVFSFKTNKIKMWIITKNKILPYGETYISEFCSKYLGIHKTPELFYQVRKVIYEHPNISENEFKRIKQRLDKMTIL